MIAFAILRALYADSFPPGVDSRLILSNAACARESLLVKCVLVERFDSKWNPSHLTNLGEGCMHSPSTLIGCSHTPDRSLGVLQCIRSVLCEEKLRFNDVAMELILVKAPSRIFVFWTQEFELTVICMSSTYEDINVFVGFGHSWSGST